MSSVQTRHLFQIIHLVSYKETFLQGRRLLGSFNESIKNFNVHSLSFKLSKENFGTKKNTTITHKTCVLHNIYSTLLEF